MRKRRIEEKFTLNKRYSVFPKREEREQVEEVRKGRVENGLSHLRRMHIVRMFYTPEGGRGKSYSKD